MITLCPIQKFSLSNFGNVLQVTLVLGYAAANVSVIGIDTDEGYSPSNCLPSVLLLFWKLSCLQSPQDREREK